jgi:DNA polymerase III epsilon subunit family exonuclease
LINPEIDIPKASTNIHGITNDMVLSSPKINNVIDDFLKFIKNSILVAHNAYFDASFISYNLILLKKEIPNNIIFDTKILASKLVGTRSYKLASLVDYFNLEYSIYHRALQDSNYCMKVFINLLKLIGDYETLELSDIIKYNNPINFNLIFNIKEDLNIPEEFKFIFKFIENKKTVKIVYKNSNGEILERKIKPFNFIELKGKIYLEAFCYLRNDKRIFKLKNIISLSL